MLFRLNDDVCSVMSLSSSCWKYSLIHIGTILPNLYCPWTQVKEAYQWPDVFGIKVSKFLHSELDISNVRFIKRLADCPRICGRWWCKNIYLGRTATVPTCKIHGFVKNCREFIHARVRIERTAILLENSSKQGENSSDAGMGLERTANLHIETWLHLQVLACVRNGFAWTDTKANRA